MLNDVLGKNSSPWLVKGLVEQTWIVSLPSIAIGLIADRGDHYEWQKTLGKVAKTVPLCIVTGALGLASHKTLGRVVPLSLFGPALAVVLNACLREAGKVDREKSKKFDAILTKTSIGLGVSMAALGMITRTKVVTDWFFKTFPHPSGMPLDD